MKIPKLTLKFSPRFKGKGSTWQKALFGVILATLILMAAATLYLVFKPITREVRDIIDQEISSSDIIFDQKTINSIKERQNPSTVPDTTGGKNPFAPF